MSWRKAKDRIDLISKFLDSPFLSLIRTGDCTVVARSDKKAPYGSPMHGCD